MAQRLNSFAAWIAVAGALSCSSKPADETEGPLVEHAVPVTQAAAQRLRSLERFAVPGEIGNFAASYVRRGEGIMARGAAGSRAEVVLPSSAAGETSIRDTLSGVGVRVRLANGRPSALAEAS